VREAVGLAAYAAGDWSTAIADLRAYHRMTGSQTHLAEIADSERAQGHPERAIDLYRGADVEKLDKSSAIELLIVAAGARGDLGQHDAAVAMLQVRELTTDDDADWAARLRYAYADALLAADRREEAREWFSRAAAVDEDQLTDATERLLELDGITIEGDEDEDEELEAEDRAAAEDDAEDDEDFEDDDLDDEDEDELSARGDGLPDDDDDLDDEDDEDVELDEVDAKAKAEDDIVDDDESDFEQDVDAESNAQAGADGQGDAPAAGSDEKPAAGSDEKQA